MAASNAVPVATVVRALRRAKRGDTWFSQLIHVDDAISIIRSVAARAGRKKPTRIEITRAQALRLGIVFCRCGHPPNNHFQHGTKPCAHCKCKEYRETIHAP